MQRLTLVKSNSSVQSAIRSIYEGGIRNFYAGIVPRLIGIIPMRLVYWGTLNSMNAVTHNQKKYIQYTVPGLTAGFAQTLIDNPIEVMKVKIMTGASHVEWRSLYNGFLPCLYRNTIFAISVGVTTKIYGKENPFLAGAVGGFLGSLISHPFDVVKTELQRHQKSNEMSINTLHSKSTTQILRELYQISPAKLWSGATMRCTLGFANMGIGFLALSHIQEIIRSLI